MELKKINSLVELSFKKFEEKTTTNSKKNQEPFLISLKNKEFPNTLSGPFTYSWRNIQVKISILSNYLRKIISNLLPG